MSLKEQQKKTAAHLSNEDIDRYRGRTMSPMELLAANDHLTACDTCHDRFGGDYLQEAFELARQTLLAVEDDRNIAEGEGRASDETA